MSLERTINTSISRQNIQDQIAALLYATGLVKDNEDIINVKFNGNLNTDELIPIDIKFRTEQEVTFKKYNG